MSGISGKLSDEDLYQSDFKMQNSELHRQAVTSGMIEGMINPFESIMRCIRFFAKLPLDEIHSFLFFTKRLHHRITILSKAYFAVWV